MTLQALGEEELAGLCRGLSRVWGLDLSAYNRSQLQRRLRAMMAAAGIAAPEEFLAYLKREPEASRRLRDHFTINVTQFFRDRALFDELENLLRAEGFGRQCRRVWSAACSTGMEPYSVAMILDGLSPTGDWRVEATDIEEAALEKARAGVYSAREVESVPAARHKYLREVAPGQYQVAERLRRRVRFGTLDLLDPRGKQPRGCDLVLCRNVVIYFSAEGKLRVARLLAEALRPGGLLFVGATERLPEETAGEFLALRPFFYQRKAA